MEEYFFHSIFIKGLKKQGHSSFAFFHQGCIRFKRRLLYSEKVVFLQQYNHPLEQE